MPAASFPSLQVIGSSVLESAGLASHFSAMMLLRFRVAGQLLFLDCFTQTTTTLLLPFSSSQVIDKAVVAKVKYFQCEACSSVFESAGRHLYNPCNAS